MDSKLISCFSFVVNYCNFNWNANIKKGKKKANKGNATCWLDLTKAIITTIIIIIIIIIIFG